MSSEEGESSGGFEDKRENISPEARARKRPWSGAHRDGAFPCHAGILCPDCEASSRLLQRARRQTQHRNFTPSLRLAEPGYFHSSHQPLCQGGDMGRLADSHKTGGLYGRPCRLLFLLAALCSPPRCLRSLSTDGSAQTDRVCFT